MSARLRVAEQEFKQRLARFQPQPQTTPLSDHIVLHYNGDPGMKMSYNFTLAVQMLPDKVLDKMVEQISRELSRRRGPS